MEENVELYGQFICSENPHVVQAIIQFYLLLLLHHFTPECTEWWLFSKKNALYFGADMGQYLAYDKYDICTPYIY